mmetsp:Transcript_36994/g.81258  ORF Transcript_36994/g.81258 Transcript_36994/m.81258 type:complete len:448 (-) Transcript_36994:34-1377(-)
MALFPHVAAGSHFLIPLLRTRGFCVSGRRCLSALAPSSGASAAPQGPELQAIGDDEIARLSGTPQPIVLHCGAAWSERSRRVAERLAEWSHAGRDSEGILCFTADLYNVPRLVKEKHIKSLPTVLLLRNGKTEDRVDAADVAALERLMVAASRWSSNTELVFATATAATQPESVFAAAEELAQREAAEATELYRRVLDSGAAHLAFRARLGLLSCALETVQEGQRPTEEILAEVNNIVQELNSHHSAELRGEGEDGPLPSRLVAHASLLLDAWVSSSRGSEDEVLQLYAAGCPASAMQAALEWYRQEAGGDIEGLVAAHFRPGRLMPDRPGQYPESLFSREPFASEIAHAFGPVRPRSMLRRLLTALGPDHEVALQGQAELEFLLDTKERVPFHTRFVWHHMGGKPRLGRGSGRTSGYSNGTWIAWGYDRMRRNTRRMNSPHCEGHD